MVPIIFLSSDFYDRNHRLKGYTFYEDRGFNGFLLHLGCASVDQSERFAAIIKHSHWLSIFFRRKQIETCVDFSDFWSG